MGNESLKILVVEDDFFVKAEIIRILEKSGHNVIGDGNNGKVGIEKAQQLNPDIILMDIKMDVMDGIEAAKIIQEKTPTPIVFLTAHESKDMVQLATEAGAGSYLTKPPRAQDMDRAMTIAMARHNDIMELRCVNSVLEKRTAELEQALEKIKTLQGIIPICSQCKKIRDDQGYWNILESYIQKHSEVQFSHGICPECSDELYRNDDWYIEMKKDQGK
jgi:CheY-like chemotaxis protein